MHRAPMPMPDSEPIEDDDPVPEPGNPTPDDQPVPDHNPSLRVPFSRENE